MMVAGLLLTTFLAPAPAFVRAAMPTFAAMVGIGLVATLMSSPVSPAVTSAVDRMGAGGGGYSSAFGMLNLSYAVGMMAGPLLGGIGVDLMGFRPSMAVFGACFGVSALILRRLLPSDAKSSC